MAVLPVSSFSSPGSSAPSSINDIWGWTDAQTGREYALVGLNNGTAFVDVTTPSAPVYLGKLPTATSSSLWRDVKTVGDHAFIVSEAGSHGMQVFDLTRLRNVSSPPVTFASDADFTGFGSAHNIVANDASGVVYAVGTGSCAGGLYMVDVTTPQNPTFAGCYSGDGYTHDAQCVVYSGPDTDHQGKEICVASNTDTVTIVDVTNKSNPVQLARSFYPSPSYTHQGWFTADQRYFVVNDELDGNSSTPTRTIVMDLLDLDSPEFSFFQDGTTSATDHNLYIHEGRVYQSNYAAGLRVLDASNIAGGSLPEIAYFDTYPANDAHSFNGQWSNYPYFASGSIIASDQNNGLFVMALSSGGGNQSPNAAFAFSCTDLDCAFTDQSSDADGSITGWSWSFGDGGTSNAQNPSHTFAANGTYTVSLTATDNEGATNGASQSVTVSTGGDPIALATSVRTGRQIRVDLDWTGSDGQGRIEIYRDGSFVRRTRDDGSFTDKLGADPTPGTYDYQVCDADNGDCSNISSVSVNEGVMGGEAPVVQARLGELPQMTELIGSYPNPFRGTATLRFNVAEVEAVQLVIYNGVGQEVARLVDGSMEAGQHEAQFDASALPSGVYLARMTTGSGVSQVQRLTMVK